MKFEEMKKLQNGSDIRGTALTEQKDVPADLTETEACLLAKGYLLWLSEKTGKKPQDLTISLGRDPRLTGKRLLHGLCSGLGPYGPSLLDCGLASTPAMFMSTVFPGFNCDGAIMITASHLPYTRNGFKFFDREGGLEKSDITAIIRYAAAFSEEDGDVAARLGPAICENDFDYVMGTRSFVPEKAYLMDAYCEHLKRMITDGIGDGEEPLTGMKITVDAGNGSGGFYARDVLEPLGADISSSQFLEPDGTFPNHIPNPENKEAMDSISRTVLTSGADLGLIFDTDVDRSAAVDGKGREIARNGIVALAAALVAEDHPGTTVVTDSVTSDQLTAFIEGLGLRHLRFKRGYKNVINKSKELNNEDEESWLAIETSGHAAMRENHFLDDGAYLATKIVIRAALLKKEGKGIDSLIASLKEPAEAREVRMDLKDSDYKEYGARILSDLRAALSAGTGTDAAAAAGTGPGTADADGAGAADAALSGMSLVSPNYEGVRINFAPGCGSGWCLLRQSLHDPLMPLNMESNSPGGVDIIAGRMKNFLSQYKDLDISKL